MKMEVQNYDDVNVLELQGEFTNEFVKPFEDLASELLAADNCFGLVLDMTAVGYLDSAAIEKLLWLSDACREKKRLLKLAGLDENCKKILELTRLENAFDQYSELAKAVKSFV
jgi:anti-anti-sigma factor